MEALKNRPSEKEREWIKVYVEAGNATGVIMKPSESQPTRSFYLNLLRFIDSLGESIVRS